MLNLIVAALVAAAPAAPAAPAQPADAHAQHGQMGAKQPGQMDHGKMAEMKDCCCKDMMAKMHGSPTGQPPQHKQ